MQKDKKTETQVFSIRISEKDAELLQNIASGIGTDVSGVVRRLIRQMRRFLDNGGFVLKSVDDANFGPLCVSLRVRNTEPIECTDSEFRDFMRDRCADSWKKIQDYRAIIDSFAREGEGYIVVDNN